MLNLIEIASRPFLVNLLYSFFNSFADELVDFVHEHVNTALEKLDDQKLKDLVISIFNHVQAKRNL